MIDPDFMHDKRALSIRRQCKLLMIAPSTVHYKPREARSDDEVWMKRIDELYTRHPFYGSRQLVRALKLEGFTINRKRVQRLMRRMGLQALCPKPNLSKPNRAHRAYPYLMRGMNIDRPGQAWCSDITYIRMERGFAYLTVIMDWYSRKVLSWRLSNSLDSRFCVDALEEALRQNPAPEVMNTDQGCQYTGNSWIKTLKDHQIKISMDGRGRALDNVFVERLWRSVKYEEVYRREYQNLQELEKSLSAYFGFYNTQRPHSSLDGKPPISIHPWPETLRAA